MNDPVRYARVPFDLDAKQFEAVSGSRSAARSSARTSTFGAHVNSTVYVSGSPTHTAVRVTDVWT